MELSHHQANAMGELAALGILAELDGYLRRDGKGMRIEDYFPGALEAGRWKSKQVGLVYRGVTVQGILYNLKLIEQAGQPSPLDLYARNEWTWQRLRELAKPLTFNVQDPNPGNRVFGTSNWIMASFFTCAVPLAAWGHEIAGKDGKIAPPPRQKTTASLLNAEQICLLQHGKQKDAAWEYLKFAAGQDEQAQMAKAFGNAPPYKSLFDGFVRDAYDRFVREAIVLLA